MVNLSQRAEIVKRMDSQFNSNLEMRRTLHALDQRAKAIYANCKLFQKVRVLSTGGHGQGNPDGGTRTAEPGRGNPDNT